MEKKDKPLATQIIKELKIKNIILTILLICSVGYNIYLLSDINTTTTTETYEIEQDSGDNGNNNVVVGNDNEVNNG